MLYQKKIIYKAGSGSAYVKVRIYGDVIRIRSLEKSLVLSAFLTQAAQICTGILCAAIKCLHIN